MGGEQWEEEEAVKDVDGGGDAHVVADTGAGKRRASPHIHPATSPLKKRKGVSMAYMH